MNSPLETVTVASAFHHSAVEYDRHVQVQKRVVEQLAASVTTHVPSAPGHILDVGTGTGALLERLLRVYPQARLTGVDVALNMCRRASHKLNGAATLVNGAVEQLPFQNSRFDLVVSASVLQWVTELATALSEMRRVITPGGSLSLAFFCAGTLHEMQHCMRQAAGQCENGKQLMDERLHRFWQPEEVRSMLETMDFEQAVMTVETEVDWYDDLFSLLRSIKAIGAGAVSGSGSTGLGWRGILTEAARLYQEQYGRNNKIPATYQVLYLSARTPR